MKLQSTYYLNLAPTIYYGLKRLAQGNSTFGIGFRLGQPYH
jgi:hypothetical protein